MLRKTSLWGLLLLATIVLAGCGGSGGGGGSNNPTGSNWDEMVWDQDNWA